MASDPAMQWSELSERYHRLSDDELEPLAAEAYDLTEIAQQALQAEITSRGLAITLQTTPLPSREEDGKELPDNPEFDPANFNLITALRCWDVSQARTAKDILDNVRIPSWFGPDNLERVDEYHGSFDRGVDLKICEEDKQYASAALAQYWPKDDRAGEGDQAALNKATEEDAELVCPKCHSAEIVFESLEKTSPGGSDLDAMYNWHCDACGHNWQDDGVEQEA